MEDFKKALEGTLGRKHIDNIVDQVAPTALMLFIRERSMKKQG